MIAPSASALTVSLLAATLVVTGCGSGGRPAGPVSAGDVEATRVFCGACHPFPAPDTFPQFAWPEHVKQGYVFADRSGRRLPRPSLEAATAWYVDNAPAALSLPDRSASPGDLGLTLVRRGAAIPGRPPIPHVSDVRVVELAAGRRGVLVCECDPLENTGAVHFYEPAADRWTALCEMPGPARAEVVDLDRDGIPDVLAACLGSFFPTDDRVGGLVWLRGREDGGFAPFTLLTDIGRTADVRAADFDGDGETDILVAEFGWNAIGGIRLLRNRTQDWSRPAFEMSTVEPRTGCARVSVADLDADGRPDFVALFCQEHESVVAFLNRGDGRFHPETIFTGPHPGYGSSAIDLADIDGDGDLDVAYGNGDVLQEPFVLRPYQGVAWLENKGGFPFAFHRLADLPGVHGIVATDVEGDGDLDIVATSYVPAEELNPEALDLTSVLVLEQTERGEFARRRLETKTCNHFTCAAGDLRGDGRRTIVVGNFYSTTRRPIERMIDLWEPESPGRGGVAPK